MTNLEEAREQAREALELIHAWAQREQAWDTPRALDFARIGVSIRALLDATEPRPITDEMVEAAAEALRPGLFTGSLAQYERRYDNYGADARAAHQESVLEDVRAALEAAEEARR